MPHFFLTVLILNGNQAANAAILVLMASLHLAQILWRLKFSWMSVAKIDG